VKPLTTAGVHDRPDHQLHIVVANAGPSTATNTCRSRHADESEHYESQRRRVRRCVHDRGLASGANVTINVTATINAAGSFDNMRDGLANEPDPIFEQHR